MIMRLLVLLTKYRRVISTILGLPVHVKSFGTIGGGLVDDAPSFQAAIDYVYGIGGGTVVFTDKHLIGSNITIKDNVTLLGPIGMPDELLPAAAADFEGKKGVLIVPSTATITLNDCASLGNCVVIRQGLDSPFADATAAAAGIAAFAGTAVTVAGAGCYLHHMLVLGFERAIDGNGYERTRCEYISGDCTNGIRLQAILDISYIENCHFWPFLTAHQSWNTSALAIRSGAAFEYANIGGWSKITNCFSYGYLNGIVIDSCDHIQVIGGGSDYPAALSSVSVGLTVKGTSRDASIVGYQAAAQGKGIWINSSTTYVAARISGADLFSNDTYHVHVQDGYTIFTSSSITDGSIGVQIDSTSDGAMITDNSMTTVTTPIVATGTALELSDFINNRFFNCTDSLGARKNLASSAKEKYITGYNTSTIGFDLVGRIARGSTASPTVASDGDAGLSLSGKVYDGSNFNSTARVRMAADGAPSAGATPGKLIFSTTSAASTTLTDRFIIDKSGNFLPITDNAYDVGSASKRINEVFGTNVYLGPGSARLTAGTGSPEGVITAAVGSMYMRTDGGANTTLYIKESGASTTGWVAK